MAANTCTSKTGTMTGSDPGFVLTQDVRNKKTGVFLFLKYTIGTSGGLTVTIRTIVKHLSSTDLYQAILLTGAAVSALSYTIAASGNYKIPIPLALPDDVASIAIVFGSAGKDAAVVANILEE